jgi:predicted DNA-binding protein with PD1-like motif
MQALVIQPLVTIGSHLLEGNIVYTNVEIIMGESKKLQFTSEKDGPTPWNELQIKHIE